MLSAINTQLIDTFGPLGPLMGLGFLGLVMIIAVLPLMLQKKSEPFDKLKALRQEVERDSAGAKQASLRAGSNKVDKLRSPRIRRV